MAEAPINKYDLLPNIEGPKLHRFNDGQYKKIEYLDLLSSSDDSDEPFLGDHGYVFSVLIDSQPFALKIVGFALFFLELEY